MGQSWTGGLAQGCAPVFQPFGEPGEISGRDISINICDIIVTFINSSHPQYVYLCFTCSVFINTSYHPYKSGTQQQADIHQVILSLITFFGTNNFNATGTGQSQLISAADKVCTRSLGKPHEQWTVSLKVRLRCHDINQYMMVTFVVKIIFIIIIMFLNVF